MDTLRFLTAGHVDDGKSTLIGRLLLEYEALFDDQLDALRAAGGAGSLEFNLAHVTDGLKAERERGITIDVSYTSFRTERRRFRIADAPGHVEFTRNMVTAASASDAMVLLVDVTRGISSQTVRHSAIAALLNMPYVMVVVNKMDAVGWAQDAFHAVAEACAQLPLGHNAKRYILPASALTGEQIRHSTGKMPWYTGPTLMDLLHSAPLPIPPDAFRMPVQLTIGRRYLAGQVTGGMVAVGDEVVALPLGVKSRVTGLSIHGEPVQEAQAGQPVLLSLSEGADVVGRGTLLCPASDPAETFSRLSGVAVWLSETPAQVPQRCRVRIHTAEVGATLVDVPHVLDPDRLEAVHARAEVLPNRIAHLRLVLDAPVAADLYAHHPATGSFLLTHPETGEPLAGGVVLSAD